MGTRVLLLVIHMACNISSLRGFVTMEAHPSKRLVEIYMTQQRRIGNAGTPYHIFWADIEYDTGTKHPYYLLYGRYGRICRPALCHALGKILCFLD